MDDRFKPLPPDEIADAVAILENLGPDKQVETLSPPADAEPVDIAAGRMFGRKPDMIWQYENSDGSIAFYVARWNEGGDKKTIRPVSWCRDDAGDGWQFKAWPQNRPLYNLPEIINNSSMPVVICEGEKSADAAARIFPKSVATTSSGGSKAASKTDWSPLAGRRVLIWPDNDNVGLDYALEIASQLDTLNCDISIIDAAALSSLMPDGSKREPVSKWDAAKAIEPCATDYWQDLDQLRRVAVENAKPFEPGPAYISFKPYEMAASGLTVDIERGKGDNVTTETVWICSAFEVLGRSRDPNGRGWGKWLRWKDADGRTHLQHISDGALQGDLAPLCGGLASDGLQINRTQHKHLAGYLGAVHVKSRVTIVAHTGWHDIGGQSVFVLVEETIGPRGTETVILDAAAVGPYESRGVLKDWKNGVATLASGHALPVLAISTALAGPLLHLAGHEGGGLNIFGGSSKGKTTLLQAAASVWGRGATPGYVRSWRATANGLEGAAASASDTTLVLDELGMVEAREAAAALYGLANGAGKARAARDGSLREPKSWRVLVLSSAEIPVESKLGEDKGKKPRAGQLVRMLDLPADRGKGFGAFDHGGHEGDAGKLSNAFKHAAITAFGTAGPQFVRRLIAEEVTGEDVRGMVSEFMSTEVPKGSDGQIDRAAQRLGLIAAAGELAIALDIVPWRAGEARDAAAWALCQWINGRGGTEPAEIRQAIEQVRLAIESHGDSRFEAMDDPEARPVSNRLGWRKGHGAKREWLIPPETWKAEICSGLDPKLVARTLAERGILKKASDGFQTVVKINESPKRVYVINASIFDGGSHEA